jgi:hypothetical protein
LTAALHRYQCAVGALLARNPCAVAALFLAFFGHDRTVGALLHFDSASIAHVQREIRGAFRGVINAVRRAGCVK